MPENEKKTKEEKLDYSFTFNQEIGSGEWESRIPHWPGGESGVTLGSGYDMKERNEDQVYKDLKGIVGEEKARKLSKAAGIKPEDAEGLVDKWVKEHRKGKKMTEDEIEKEGITRKQEKALFDILVPKYEEKAEKDVNEICGEGTWDKLNAEQKEMLFDHSYNPGLSKFPNFTKAVVNENWEEALKQYERKSKGKLLEKRNKAFKKKYLDPKVGGKDKDKDKDKKKKKENTYPTPVPVRGPPPTPSPTPTPPPSSGSGG